VRVLLPNFHGVLLGMTILHICLGAAALFGPHNMLWHYFGGRPGLAGIAVMHWTVAAMIVVGAYTRFVITSTGLLFSFSLYLLQLCLFMAAIIHSISSGRAGMLIFEGPINTVALMLLSLVAYRQPVVQVTLQAPEEFD
jgi:hypothetical protein